jgi:hypothetical protein
MLAVSFATVLEEASSKNKHLGGNVKDLDELLEPDNLTALSGLAKAFCFLAYHSHADTAIAEYVRAGTLPDDSGPDVLVLFALDSPAPTPVTVGSGTWLEVEAGVHPAYQMVRILFDSTPVPPLPGLVFFQGLLAEGQAVYIPLDDLPDEQTVRARLRRVFAMAAHAASKYEDKHILDNLCVALRNNRIKYRKTMRTSMREWLIRAFQLVHDHSGDIVRAINFFGKAMLP